MNTYSTNPNDLMLGLGISGVLFIGFILSCIASSKTNNDTTQIINTLSSVISGEIECLRYVKENENPYDLFTRIYPTLKEMDNERIQEFIDILERYNDNWICNDDN
jgi:hypothetical protein